MSAGRVVKRAAAGLAAAALLALAVLLALGYRSGGDDADGAPAFEATAEHAERGAYLARAGNCAACHTPRGGAAYSGGRGIATPFGTVYASNITPDVDTGIGSWTSTDFWRAMHHGRSKDGRLLYPAFPYTSYTRVSREDTDAILAFLKTQVAPVRQDNRPHAVRFPYDSQLALAAWRGLFFRPGGFEPEAARAVEWNRGAYLVQGLGHCSACHAARNVLGASSSPAALGGGLIPAQDWYAPSLAAADQAGVADWPIDEVVALLREGISPRGSVLGPMAEVVQGSTQHLSDTDLRAMATYLKALPPLGTSAAPSQAGPPDPDRLQRGARLYEKRCADCHGDAGQGAPGVYPALAGNRAVMMEPPLNVIRVVLAGGFPPSTGGNPRPYGMPPFGTELSDADVAAVVSYIRASWGNAGSAVGPRQVDRLRRTASE